jgi:hypothetical protein
VRSGSILFVATVACASEGVVTLPTERGTIHLTLTGLHSSAQNGGTATATPAGGGGTVTIVIPADGDQSELVPVGTYAVTYQPPSNHILAPGSTVPATVTIEQDQTTTIELTLIARGNIGVAVTGLSGGQGGSAVAQRTDAAGTPVNITVAANGTGIASNVPVGTYNVTYTAPAGFNVTTANPVTGINVVPGATVQAAYTVATAAPSTGTVQITVGGLPGTGSGGTAVVQRTDAAGSPINVPINSAGSGSVSNVPAGTYSVTYTPPASRVVSTTNPVTGLVVTAGGTVSASFTVIAAPPTTGTIQVTVTGITGTSGGSAVAQRTDAAGSPINITVNAAGSGSASNVPPGTYSVTYTAPTGFTISTTNPVTGIVVTAGNSSPAAFTVVAVPPGSAQISVTGLTGATGGGSVAVRLTNNTGPTYSGNLPAPDGSGASAVAVPSIPPGSFNVTYTPPAGFQLASGQTNPQVVVITSGNTSNASFVAQQIQTPQGLVFVSDWRTATGNTQAAVSDGGKWDDYFTGTTRQMIIAATGLDFPSGMANVFRMRCRETTDTQYSICQKFNGWPLPSVGGSIYRRVYFRNTLVGSGISFHPYEPQPGACATESNTTFGGGDPFDLELRDNDHRWAITLPKHQTYRYEERYRRTGPNRWIIEARIYNSANVLIRTNADFRCTVHTSPGHTLANALECQVSDSCIVHHSIGWQGGGGNRGSDNENQNSIYWGGYAVSLADWIGPYTPSEVP